MSTSKEREEAGQMLRRLGDMGIKAKLMQGDRCVLASMRLSDAPFRTLRGSVRFDQVMFAGVGRDRIKCVAPRPLFQLPMIHILDCRDSTEVEARIRLACHCGHPVLWFRSPGPTTEVSADADYGQTCC